MTIFNWGRVPGTGINLKPVVFKVTTVQPPKTQYPKYPTESNQIDHIRDMYNWGGGYSPHPPSSSSFWYYYIGFI